MKYKIGTVEYYYDEKERVGVVRTDSETFTSENALILLNIFTNEIERRLRKRVQMMLESEDINKYTGIPNGRENENEISSC